uniref:Actin n=1 Tax=Eucampia antarctica TaxID=49252 RepID=A0A6U0STM8_9STRA|mmetsp:Transcript_4146/g.3934  ORF Transcript_4146/g.3934 Transcript_4146/m.3934 type:complete len:412 (+) Transcript_4146:212-1447(+)|eukprot:CAMPEP_0197832088 /NCGR_PEP_ID=MMETSP1437-20131217/13242_1 /TAXON_ID=49252 ORGANISM="Eucampia antarctica, Strain CCMP1452" /NCGR_SAMPLE_ID=MMETSP1437 /ASSEMBLY_ACC=CAM_ASM_001096 /LENGTH=411 /DNA_ID=CAMNT_0043435275 /DNA_START=75 /DNA_END=1310 /DNA_ORIENTATION=-
MSNIAKDAGKEGDGSSSRSAALLNQPIVMDVGTCTTKAGFAGGSKPKVNIGTKVGRAKHVRIMPGGALEQEQNSSVFVGTKLDDHRGAFLLDYPMDKGCVKDNNAGWESMERIWEHVYGKACLNAKMEDHPVLLTECPLNPKTHRERMAEVFFETFRAPALCLAPPAVLSLYASGRTTGVVLDVGEGVAHCIPVYEGYALPHSITRSNVAGRDVTDYLQLLLRRGSGLHLTTTAERDLCQTIKEQACYLSTTATSNNNNNSNSNVEEGVADVPYQLPDGQTINLTHQERSKAPEILFDPFLMGSEEMGVADLVSSAIAKSDLDLRTTLYSQIVLAGGSTHTPGFGDRFLAELRSRAPAHTRIRISAPPERIHSAWAGGSILASLSTFKHMWVTAAEYEEHGNRILQNRGSL